jgi:hypothetical protein
VVVEGLNGEKLAVVEGDTAAAIDERESATSSRFTVSV